MKIRQGFVSNSSTTSFLIYGVSVDDAELVDKAWDVEGIEGYGNPYDSGGWIGASWCQVRDDETGAQFKARVEAKLFTELGIKPEQCDTIEQAWRDG